MDQSKWNSSSSADDTIYIPEPLMTSVVIFMSLLTFIGTIGNSLVICAVLLYRKLRRVRNVLITNLAVADLIVTTMIIPLSIAGAIVKRPFLDTIPCEIVAALTVTSCIASIYSIANIALERYIFMCHNHIYSCIYNKRKIPFIVMCIWLYAFLVDLPNFEFVGWGDHGYTPETQSCTFNFTAAIKSGYMWFLTIFAWIIALGKMCFCYLRLFLFVRRHSLGRTQRRIKASDKELLKVLAVIFAFFLVMWTPFTLFSVLNIYVAVPAWVLFVTGHLCLANSTINFLIYAFSEDFRNGYWVVFYTMLGRRERGMDKDIKIFRLQMIKMSSKWRSCNRIQ